MTIPAHVLPLDQSTDIALVGGKAAGLARMINQGLPVPDGFVISTKACQYARHAGSPLISPGLHEQIRRAYHDLGSPPVAVRSSATAEDMPHASMAGQYETVLNIQGDDELIDAIQQCWQSLGAPRLLAYLARCSIDPADVRMAVIVQRMIPADTAGILFTVNPRNADPDEMLLEAAWGLGEPVVSGTVQPDEILLDARDGRIIHYWIKDKDAWLRPGMVQPEPLPDDKRNIRCLTDTHIRDLWQLAKKTAGCFNAPQDIEWAIHNDRVYLLQSRAITTLEPESDQNEFLNRLKAKLTDWKHRGRGDWMLHNLAETLPHPTPLTWSIIRRFMSGRGGFGNLYRLAGFQPSQTIERDGFLDLITGRIYMDLARAPDMFFPDFPFRYDLDLLRCNPDAAQKPPTIPAGSLKQRLKIARKLQTVRQHLTTLAADFDRKLENDIIPEFTDWVRREKQCDLQHLSPEQWADLWHTREKRILDEFAPQILLPGLIVGMTLDELQHFLARHFWRENPAELLDRIAIAPQPDLTIQSSQILYDIAAGNQIPQDWLDRFGHRAPDEFDLATPRRRERPQDIESLARRLTGDISPLRQFEARLCLANQTIRQLESQLSPRYQTEFRRPLSLLQRYLPYRENGKHVFMLGYDLLRDLAREAARRLHAGNDVFLLTFDELRQALTSTAIPRDLIEHRRQIRRLENQCLLPPLLTAADIDTLGTPPFAKTQENLPALCLSTGLARGPVRIVHTPDAAGDLGRDYILTCPSTDPNWTPLFYHAAGLILECGGALSHGAVVAREMGIPAVVLPGATQLLTEGETVTLDAHHETVCRPSASSKAPPPAAPDPDNVNFPAGSLPPTPGPIEQRCARIRNIFLLVWTVLLIAVFTLPAPWLHDPTLKIMDAVLWPFINRIGKPALVALIAVVFAVVSLLGQRFLTDNPRLHLVKHRTNRLRRLAAGLPLQSPRRQTINRHIAAARTRLLAAAFFPIAILLGPMILTFDWLPHRIDPAVANPRPGAVACITAAVDGDYLDPITLQYSSGLQLDPDTPSAQSLPPIRPTLEKLLADWQQSPPDASITPALITDLESYLAASIPPHIIFWNLTTPANRSARYRLALQPQNHSPVPFHLSIGNAAPPEPTTNLRDGKGPVQLITPQNPASPIRRIQIGYHQTQTIADLAFWRPLHSLGLTWDPGWLLTYIAAYLLTFIPLRLLLKPA